MVLYQLLFRDVQKKKNEPSKFDIRKVNEKIPFKFDYFAGKEVGESFFILKVEVILKVRYAKSEG